MRVANYECQAANRAVTPPRKHYMCPPWRGIGEFIFIAPPPDFLTCDALLLHRDLDITAAVPADLHGNLAVGERFLADVVARPVVDLLVGPFIDPEDQHQAAAGLEFATHQPLASERQLLALARPEKVSMDSVP